MIILPPLSDDPLREPIRKLASCSEDERVAALLAEAETRLGDGREITALATSLIESIREKQRYRAGINALLIEYSLSSREGVVLMCLAEALLRVPDRITQDRLIRDKLGGGDWRSHVGGSQSLFVNASAWGLLLTGKVIQLRHEDSDSSWRMLKQTVGRAGEPAIRAAMRLAMRIMGTQFVLGTDIDAALDKSREWHQRGYRYSYDMLGEGARNAADAKTYFQSYYAAIESVGQRSNSQDPITGPGISIKLSALHPRFELAQSARLRRELVPCLLELAQLARSHNLGLTIDAEEANRLELTLDVLESVYLDASLADWEGLGIAIQAYLKTTPAVIDWLGEQSARRSRRIMVRLVKGAYWDSEIKHAQAMSHARYPVFTRKASTDVSYLNCAARLLERRDRLYPMFATHNAHSAAAILSLCGKVEGFEFQRLHGMGEELYEELLEQRRTPAACRIYAPVGVHRDLLAYLVRRLLENGANSSFVHNLADESLTSAMLAADPRERLRGLDALSNRNIPLPEQIFGESRRNSRGIDLNETDTLREVAHTLARWTPAAERLGCAAAATGSVVVINPANHAEILGHYLASDEAIISAAIERSQAAAASWSTTPVSERANCLRRAAAGIEDALLEICGYCIKEAGKTLRDAVADVREAIDFCRYYANEAEALFHAHGAEIEPRGPLLCISPWNFPSAIFAGQISAALAAGNTVIAKPAEQTTLIALRLLEIFHTAGVPRDALIALCGPGEPVGKKLLPDPRLAGVLFTGSTEVARHISGQLAARSGRRALLIAETGGQNALVVDSTALPEQVVDDVVASGFNSAGQRCSALRVLYVQEEIAERLIDMLQGAMQELRIGDPADVRTDIGPIIDVEARTQLQTHTAYLQGKAKLLAECEVPEDAPAGSFFAPRLYEIPSLETLQREVFGPIVHLIRYAAKDLDDLPQRINAAGYGLTFGVHSRIQTSVDGLARAIHAGNVYVNRNIIGAVVGVQPFGGQGLSGTGPKAGGPLYIGALVQHRGETPPGRPLANVAEAPAHDPGLLNDVIAALRESQTGWGTATMRSHFGPARALSERIERNALLDRETRVRLQLQLRTLMEQAAMLANPRDLPGPTGESNTLSFVGRGVLACLCRSGARMEDALLPAVAALLAGNAVLFLAEADTLAMVRSVRETLAESGIADGLSAHHGIANVAEMLTLLKTLAIDGAICHGDPLLGEYASRALASRPGAILPLIDSPIGAIYLQQYFHEKTVSVNTTASGGNTALMSQSESG